jgi:hypothetical protein
MTRNSVLKAAHNSAERDPVQVVVTGSLMTDQYIKYISFMV